MFDSMSLAEIVESCDNLEDFQENVIPCLKEFREQWKEKIRELIEESGLTKSSFAEKCGVSRQAQHKWLNGAIPKSREDYIKIGFAAGLGIEKIDQLLKKYGGYSGLYSRSLEDSVCLFVLNSDELLHDYETCEMILKNINEEMKQANKYSTEVTMGTVTIRHNLLGLRNEEELILFILTHINSYQKKYYKLYDYIEAFIVANSMDPLTFTPVSLNFLAEEQHWSSSLKQAVYQIRNKEWFPMRKKLITLGLYLNMTVDQINTMLELAQMEPLSVSNPVECAMIYAINDADLNDLICPDGGTELLEYVQEVLQKIEIEGVEEIFCDLE